MQRLLSRSTSRGLEEKPKWRPKIEQAQYLLLRESEPSGSQTFPVRYATETVRIHWGGSEQIVVNCLTHVHRTDRSNAETARGTSWVDTEILQFFWRTTLWAFTANTFVRPYMGNPGLSKGLCFYLCDYMHGLWLSLKASQRRPMEETDRKSTPTFLPCSCDRLQTRLSERWEIFLQRGQAKSSLFSKTGWI